MMMMRRRGSLFAMIAALGLVGYLWGSDGSNAQVAETEYEDTGPTDKVADVSANSLTTGVKLVPDLVVEPAAGHAAEPGAKLAAEPVRVLSGLIVGRRPKSAFVGRRFNLAWRDWAGYATLFLRTAGNSLETLKMADGRTFMGEVARGVPDGHGLLITADGTNQKGEWHLGSAYRVSGTWVAPDGTKEIGTWNYDGTPNGGTILWKDGRVYKGDWSVREGAPEAPEGMGTMTWPDGRTYTGNFLDGKMDGAGKMTYPDGKVKEGNWAQGKLIDVSGKSGSGAKPTP